MAITEHAAGGFRTVSFQKVVKQLKEVYKVEECFRTVSFQKVVKLITILS